MICLAIVTWWQICKVRSHWKGDRKELTLLLHLLEPFLDLDLQISTIIYYETYNKSLQVGNKANTTLQFNGNGASSSAAAKRVRKPITKISKESRTLTNHFIIIWKQFW